MRGVKHTSAVLQLVGTLVLGGACVFGAFSLGGCKEKASSSAKAPANTETIAYTVRGRIEQLPGALNDLSITHEAIPEFRNADGTFGMNSMNMEFTSLAPGLSINGFAVGDKVELTFEVVYGSDYRSLKSYSVTKLVKLPAETPLDFSKLEDIPGFDSATGAVDRPPTPDTP